MFEGFSNETFEFFMAIRYNNNKEFFHGNHDLYVRSLRKPCLELAESLYPAVHALSPELETRPEKVVARINRDVRFSRDKSPYRDYIWIGFRRMDDDEHNRMAAYFDLGVDGASYGAGLYRENRPLMNGLRRRLRQAPEEFMRALPDGDEFTLHINTRKRLAVPPDVDESLSDWYRAKDFYFEKELTDFDLIKSPALTDEIAAGYAKLMPIFRYMESLTPEDGDE